MAIEISTVGAKVGWAVEATAGTKPTAFTLLTNVNEAPEVALEVEAIEVPDVTATKKKYIAGLEDCGGKAQFVLNATTTGAELTSWEAMVTAATTAAASGKATWIEYWYPNASKAFFYTATPLSANSSSGLKNGELATIPANVIVNDVKGWDTKVAIS